MKVALTALVLISLAPGVGFAMQAAERSGCLLYKDSQFIILDEETREVVELHGLDLELNLGNRVEVTGTLQNIKPSVFLATAYMNVSTVSPRAQGGCLTVASALDARTEPPAGPPAKPAKPAKGKK